MIDLFFAILESLALVCIVWASWVIGSKISDIKQKGRKKIDEKQSNKNK